MFKNLKISTRLTGTLGLLLALLLAVVGVAIWQMGIMRSVTQEITGKWLPSVERVNQMDTDLAKLRVYEFRHVLNTDDKAMADIEKLITDKLATLDGENKAYVALISAEEERNLYEPFAAGWKQYLQIHDQMMVLSRKNENEKAKALLEGDSRKLFNSSSAALLKLVELNSTGARASTAEAAAAYANARNAMLGAVALAFLLVVTAAIWLIRSITGPLNQALAAADRVAAGDLSGKIDIASKDEIGLVLRALDRMQGSLTQVVSDVRQNSESVATGSAQIAQGNQDLSQRTEEQASALEETAASMEQLSSTVKQNADNARQANQLAQSASVVAIRGGDVVGQVVQTMKGINDSSKRIADIISVIDGIAFQTNILALNAAVEAARAGEQGRGFAVVATEVRSLAGRSAEAAKEIKSLITASVERVEQGTALVDQAGTTMAEVVSSIRRVTDIMGEISAASAEQSTGVAQVGEAVSQMDQVTQQNAALVEESAAAAESLKGQAEQLVRAVAVFKLPRSEGTTPACVVAPAVKEPEVDRRGPARAKNVTRPVFKREATVAQAPAPAAATMVGAPARTGTENWASF